MYEVLFLVMAILLFYSICLNVAYKYSGKIRPTRDRFYQKVRGYFNAK